MPISHSHLPALIFATALLVVLVLWFVPKIQAAYSRGATDENRFDRENYARKTLAQIVGGVFLLGGLYSSVKTFDIQRQNATLLQEGQITDRFSKAIDQLGAVSPGGSTDEYGRPRINLEVRLGGIYALERIASDSPRDQWTIMEVLMTYVRENSPSAERAEQAKGTRQPSEMKHLPPGAASPQPRVRTDIQAILTVIGRRDVTRDPPNRKLDLSGAALTGANLTGANLDGAILIKTNLSNANFMDTTLKGADLEDADLEGAALIGTDLKATVLKGADLKGADISGADLSGSILAEDQLTGAVGDSDTKLPSGVHRPASWSR